jgi:hypothetical protein
VDKVKRFAAYMGGMALMHRIAGISEKLEGH